MSLVIECQSLMRHVTVLQSISRVIESDKTTSHSTATSHSTGTSHSTATSRSVASSLRAMCRKQQLLGTLRAILGAPEHTPLRAGQARQECLLTAKCCVLCAKCKVPSAFCLSCLSCLSVMSVCHVCLSQGLSVIMTRCFKLMTRRLNVTGMRAKRQDVYVYQTRCVCVSNKMCMCIKAVEYDQPHGA